MNADEVKALRNRLHMTQKKLAEAIGVQPNTVARWERGESAPSIGMVERLETVAKDLPSGDAVIRTFDVKLDPHHGAILEALAGRLDANVFEACAVDLLRRDFPSLVAVTGGGDDGFDGAIADGARGEPYPLIVTTSQQLVPNLVKNLDQARRKGWNPTRALFATSRRITPTARRKLFEATRKRGVQLIQTCDQDWFASRLYHEPEWCKRLLRVTGRPHALSLFPNTKRPVLGTRILGREQEMRWLLDDRRGDCLLIGEPGSGKTFLLQSLALQGKARFLVDMNREQVANDLRSLKPPAVIVDDAHVHGEWVTELMQIRREVRAHFRIIAVSWPGGAAAVRTALRIGHEGEYKLESIDADTMIEIIKSAGIIGPDELLRIIRQQAAGRPGLAATLVHLCLVGDINNVVNGESLVDQTASSLRGILGEDSLSLLAPFALGGSAGARQDKVAESLGKPLPDVADALANLAASGVIIEKPDPLSLDCSWPVSVEPPAMRGALVKRIFYRGPGSLPVDKFLPVIQKVHDALATLINARACGASVPDLEDRIEKTNDPSLWLKYASLGKREVDFVLDRHPELIIELAGPSLFYTPKRAIPMLLSEAAKDNGGRGFDSSLDWTGPTSRKSVLQKIEAWVRKDIADTESHVAKRMTLLKSARLWWQDSANANVALSAMCVAFNPVYRVVRTDPGIGTKVTITEGVLQAKVIDELAKSWCLASHIMGESQRLPWAELFSFMDNFSNPRLGINDSCRVAANLMLQLVMNDLAKASRHHPGIQRRLGQFAEKYGVEFDEVSDSVFECLYPRLQEQFDPDNLDQEQAAHIDKVRRLAECWDNLSIDEITGHLARVENEAGLADTMYPRLSSEFSKALAKRRSDPVATARAFMTQRLPADLVDPFIRCAIEGKQTSWSIVEDCLKDETYKYVGVAAAIAHSSAPPQVISTAVARAKGMEQLIEHRCLRGEVSEAALVELFRAGDEDVAVAAAVGHWLRSQRRHADASLGSAWQQAILQSAESSAADSEHHSYWIGKILEQDGELATEWLIRLVKNKPDFFAYHVGQIAEKSAATLSENQRRIVLRAFPPNWQPSPVNRKVVGVLVGNSLDLYRELLNSKDLACIHLAPLAGKPGNGWETKAILALDSGYSVEEIVFATQDVMISWQGPESEMWSGWRRAFERLQVDIDPRIVRIGELGSDIMSERENKAREEERHREIHGW